MKPPRPKKFRPQDYGGPKMFEGGAETEAIADACIDAVLRWDYQFIDAFTAYMKANHPKMKPLRPATPKRARPGR